MYVAQHGGLYGLKNFQGSDSASIATIVAEALRVEVGIQW